MSMHRMMALVTTLAALGAAEPTERWPRLIGQATVGTPHFEVTAAAEWVFDAATPWRVRPGVLLNDRPLPGIGCSVGWSIADGELPRKQELFVGPNVVYHNNRHDRRNRDDELRYGFEFGALGTYAFPIVPSQPDRHWIEAVMAVGIIDHDDDWDPSLTVGAAYGYQF